MMNLLKLSTISLCVFGVLLSAIPQGYADNPNPPHKRHISGKTVFAGALSLLIWPGIGQATNNGPGDKVLTHAVIGILPPFRIWSGYDALVDRQGGYWKGRI